MLTPSCRHLLDKLDGISSDVLWNLGDENIKVYSEAFIELRIFVSKLHFEADRGKILALIEYLSKELMHPSQPNYRKEGGLTGFVFLTKSLGKASASQLLQEILPPVLDTLHDSDIAIRHLASDTIYEIARVVKRGIIMFFDRIVYVFSLLPQDSDTVPSDTNDTLTKIVEFAANEDGESSMEEFLDFLKGRLRKLHYMARLFLLHWIQINALDRTNQEWFIIEFIDAWFHKLSNPEPNERELASQGLPYILSFLKDGYGLNFEHLAKTLLYFACSYDQCTQLAALTWINEFRKLGKHQLASHYSDILAVILPCLSNAPTNICEIAREINEGIREVYPVSAERSNTNAILSVLTRGLRFGKDSQHEALLWILEILSWHRAEVISYFSENFDSLMKALTDSSDEVVLLVLQIYASIVGDAEHFDRLFDLLVQKFQSDILCERQVFLIVSHLCALLDAEKVYRKFCSLIEGEDNLEFASKFVQTLNFVLVTSADLADMRTLLNQTFVNAAGKDLFLSLYSSCCHSASAVISLCLLSQAYRHANCVILALLEEETMMMPLIGVTNIVLWLELPSFDHIKWQLLEDGKSVWLRKLLYRLMMLLPQENVAFYLLLRRLGGLPKHNSVSASFECQSCGHQHLETLQLADPDEENQDTGNTQDAINFASLLEQFMHIQRKHFNHAKLKTQLQHHNSASSSWKARSVLS